MVKVAAWLKKIFGDHSIPQYEVNPRTTEILHHLAECNRVRDRDVCLVIEDLKQKAREYESEGEIDSRILDKITRDNQILFYLFIFLSFCHFLGHFYSIWRFPG